MTQIKNKWIQTIGVTFAVSTVAASAAGGAGDWCDALKGLGKVYKNKENPMIQEVKFFGRAHYQWGYTDGDFRLSGVGATSRSFSGNGDELRRFRFGTSVKFLNGFKAVARVNLEKGGFRDTSIGYSSFDELSLSYNFGDVAGFEDFTLGYGRYKVAIGGEEHSSSKKIKTVERSNLNNFLAPERLTGGRIDTTHSGIDFSFGIFTTQEDDETIAQWDGGVAYYGSAKFEAGPGDVILDLAIIDASEAKEENETFDYDWAFSAAYKTQFANWDLLANAAFADAGAENVYGVVILPSTYLVEDKLEAVFRYQWVHATGDVFGGGSSSRGVRAVARNEGIFTSGNRFSPKGNDNHTLYAGLNYYLCGNNAKVMTGIEYETLEGDNGTDLEAYTLWAAFRAYF